MNIRKIMGVARQAALDAGRLQLKYFGKLKTSEISQKSKNDFVTTVDKMSERLILGRILKIFPDHSVQAEESLPAGQAGGLTAGGGTRWIIDPLDGTSNYIHQFPMFAVSIGVAHQGKVIAGVIYDPLHRELFTAHRGGGAYLNGRRFHVSRVARLSGAFMATGIPFRARNRFQRYFRSLKIISLASAGMRRGG